MNDKASANIAVDNSLDSTLDLLKEGYLFIPNRVDLFNSDIFETHIMGQKAVCITGRKAAKIFYNPKLFKRKGVAPKRIEKTLFGENAIQGKDGVKHLKRKLLFMDILSQENEEKVANLVREELMKSIDKWEHMDKIIMFREISKIITYVACNWVGIYISKEEADIRSKDFLRMIYSFATLGNKYRLGKEARNCTEKWIEDIVEEVRRDNLKVGENSPLYKICFFKDEDDRLLDSRVAAVEVINVIRPIVAISTYVVFALKALHIYPSCKDKIIENKDNYCEMFVEEVRRFYPFTPFVAAKVKENFKWNDYNFKKGTLVLLDIYGINHDERIWSEPYKFNPERFKNKDEVKMLYHFIPQGGGNPATTHRCPGEGMVVKVTEAVLDFMVKEINYDVKKQDLRYDLSKIPTLPRSGFVISNVIRK
ncbi:cytochrome P450 [Terrisporobacter sp.]